MWKRFEQQELLRSEILIEHEQSDFASLILKLYYLCVFEILEIPVQNRLFFVPQKSYEKI